MITPRTISIIITAYNSEKYIGDCLVSLAAQTNPDWMALIMDDGSNDKTAEILKTWAKKDPRIHVFQQKNQGSSAARNALLGKVKTPYACFVDSDDLLHPRALAVALDIMEYSGADVVEYGIARVDEAAKPADVATELTRFTAEWDTLNAPYVARKKRGGNWINVTNKLYRADIVKEIRFDPELVYEDDLWFSTLAHNAGPKKIVIGVPLYFWRKNPNSKTQKIDFDRYVGSAIRRVFLMNTYFGVGHRLNQACWQDYVRDLAQDAYRMILRKNIRHNPNSADKERVFWRASAALERLVKERVFYTSYLSTPQRFAVWLCRKKHYRLCRWLVALVG